MFNKRGYLLMGIMLAAVVFIGSAVNTSWLTRMVIRRALESGQGVVVKGVHIDRQRFSLPGHLELEGVKLGLEVNSKPFLFEAQQVSVTGLQSIFSAERRILVNAEGILARYDAGEAHEARVELAVARDGVIGSVMVPALRWDKLRVQDVFGFLVVNSSGVELRAMKFQMCGGNVTGKVIVHSGEKMQYAAEFAVEDFDVAQLVDVNAQIAAQLDGRVTGSVAWQGGDGTLDALDTDLGMPAGGKMSASLLAALTQYLPQSREKKRLELLIKKGGKLPMELFALTMKSVQARKLTGEIRLRSREINLELNLTQEINTDGTLASLWAYWQRFIK